MPLPSSRASSPPTARTAAAQRLGANVKALRERQRLSKSLLCLMSGISRPLLDAIEKGEANPTLATLARLAEALDVTESDLLA